MMMTTNMGKDKCPNCEHNLDCATGAFEEAVPNPKDLSVCIKCGTILRFADDMALEILSLNDFFELKQDVIKELFKVKVAFRALKKERGF